MQAEADKAEFFDRLYALNGSSDEEEETNEIVDVLRQLKCPLRSFLSSSSQLGAEGLNTPIPSNPVPSFHRTTSAPVSSATVVKEAPLPIRKPILPPNETATPEAAKVSVINDTLFAGPARNRRPDTERRTVSNPIPGALVLTNSTGIAVMLGKKRGNELRPGPEKRRRTEPSITLVAEDKRIFNDLIFYYIPPDDIASLRRTRIAKARSYGATWTKQWASGITHVIVDKDLSYKDVMTHLNPFLALDSLPPSMVMVNENYPLDCISYSSILDENQPQYAIKNQESRIGEQSQSRRASEKSEASLELKSAQPRKGDSTPPNQTPPRNQKLTQISQSKAQPNQLSVDSSMRAWLPKENGEIVFVESPHEATNEQAMTSEEPSRPRDALDEVLEMARAVQNLPLDDEDDDDEDRPSSSDGLEDSGSDDERRRARTGAPTRTMRRDSSGGTFNQVGFSCMTGGTGLTSSSNPNARTIELLQRMADHHDRSKDHWRSRAYRKTIGTLRKQTIKICTYEQARKLPTIGERLALKIEEIVTKDRLLRLEYAELEPSDKVLQSFLKIYGVGISQAQRWIQQGHKTLEDLKAHAPLTNNQRLGIDRYGDFLTRIPRDEVTTLGDIVTRAATSIDPHVQVIIGGSYRRGASTSGDIDCLITKSDTSSSRDLQLFLDTLTFNLTETGFLVAALAVSRSDTSSGSKWHGACVLPESVKPIWRRIDFLLVPETELGAALIYFTGDDIFNRSMRLLASYKGMRLNQRGLYKNAMRGPGRSKISQGTLIEGAHELKIFQALGVPFRPPNQRICH